MVAGSPSMRVIRVVAVLLTFYSVAFCLKAQAQDIDAAEARAIAKEAYIYGFPLVDSYGIQYSYCTAAARSSRVRGTRVHNTARVYTPEDKAIQTPNSDTPYSFVGADLRAEPLVFTVPSLQFIDI
jgi:hypothetical protein